MSVNKSTKPIGVLLFIGVVLMIVGEMLHPTGSADGDLTAWAQAAVADANHSLLSHLLLLTSFPLTLIGIIGLYRQSGGFLPALSAIIAWSITMFAGIVAIVMNIVVGRSLAAQYLDASPDAQPMIALLLDYGSMVGFWFGALLFLGQAVTFLLLGITMSHTQRGRYAMFLGAGGVGSGVLGVITAVGYVTGSGPMLLVQASVILSALWLLALGVAFWRGFESSAEGDTGFALDAAVSNA